MSFSKESFIDFIDHSLTPLHFTQIARTKLLNAGFTDSFRKVNGNVTGVYSWWAQRVRTAKANNSGWRIDYWLTSNRIADKIKRSEMIDTGERADHCPILLKIDL